MSHIVRYAPERPVSVGARATRCTRVGSRCALLVMLSCTASPFARAQPIYKCVDASARITYQSSACRNGEAIDIAPGAYDPAAAARLREDAEAWNRRDDLRRALAAREDARRQRVADADAAAPAPAYAAACDACDNGTSTLAWPYPRWTLMPPYRPPPHPRQHPHPRPPAAPYRIVIR